MVLAYSQRMEVVKTFLGPTKTMRAIGIAPVVNIRNLACVLLSKRISRKY
jgi:hypothetical protein